MDEAFTLGLDWLVKSIYLTEQIFWDIVVDLKVKKQIIKIGSTNFVLENNKVSSYKFCHLKKRTKERKICLDKMQNKNHRS